MNTPWFRSHPGWLGLLAIPPALVLTATVLCPLTGCSGGGGSSSNPPTQLTYSVMNPVWDATLAITPDQPTVTGGQATRWTVNPGLPAGLTLDPNSGVISGTPAAPTLQASYRVTAANGDGSASAALSITIASPPQITTQPTDQSVGVGQTATFQAAATDTVPFTYQWSKNATPISGATSASYTTPACSMADDGAAFTVGVIDPGGTLTSAAAHLSVSPAPSITTQPADDSVTQGAGASFTVAATGYAPLSFQWYRGASLITGCTGTTCTLASTVLADNGAAFSALVTDGHGLTTQSGSGILYVYAPPSITSQPMPETVAQGASAAFTVGASGTGAFTYQWYRGSNPIAGATASTYTLSAAAYPGDNGATFSAAVADPYGGTTFSASAALTVVSSATPANTWVSGVGDDANPAATRTAPERTVAKALTLTLPGGEVDVLDPGNFGPITITKSVTLDGPDHCGVLDTSSNGEIVVNAGAGDTVILRNLEINCAGFDGSGNPIPAAHGVQFISGGLLVLEHCTIYGFTQAGVDVALAGGGRLVMRDVHITGGQCSVKLASSALALDAVLEHCVLEGAETGLAALAGAAQLDHVRVAQNSSVGVQTQGGTISIEHSTLSGNAIAVQAVSGTVRLADDDLYDNGAAFGTGGGNLLTAGTNRLAGNPPTTATLSPLTLQ
ncbi:MAG: putative Ig domain-containing protein [Holophaga sp.]|jgi:hypothetical protein